MTAFDAVAAQLALIDYKPGWSFEAQDLGNRVALVLQGPLGVDSRCPHRDKPLMAVRSRGWSRVTPVEETGRVLQLAPGEELIRLRCACEPVQIRMTRYADVFGLEHAAAGIAYWVTNTCWDLIRCMELHEAGEWFVVDGKRPHDPHELPPPQQCV